MLCRDRVPGYPPGTRVTAGGVTAFKFAAARVCMKRCAMALVGAFLGAESQGRITETVCTRFSLTILAQTCFTWGDSDVSESGYQEYYEY
eukprot:392740-Rhodomonas_salina.1